MYSAYFLFSLLARTVPLSIIALLLFVAGVACKQALRMGYSEICFRTALGEKLGDGRAPSLACPIAFDRAPFESKSRNNPYGEPVCSVCRLLLVQLVRLVFA